MALKRYVVEFGMGADLHGQDVTKAAKKAVRDAISRSCLCGLFEIVGIKGPEEMKIKLQIACPFPDSLDVGEVRASVPLGEVELSVEKGGMVTRGLHYGPLGQGDNIVIALASLTVYVDV